MSSFLSNLVARTLGVAAVIKPQPVSRFELTRPARIGSALSRPELPIERAVTQHVIRQTPQELATAPSLENAIESTHQIPQQLQTDILPQNAERELAALRQLPQVAPSTVRPAPQPVRAASVANPDGSPGSHDVEYTVTRIVPSSRSTIVQEVDEPSRESGHTPVRDTATQPIAAESFTEFHSGIDRSEPNQPISARSRPISPESRLRSEHVERARSKVPPASTPQKPDLTWIAAASNLPPISKYRTTFPPDESPQTIQVTIGRVEVKAIIPSGHHTAAQSERWAPKLPLEEYLKQRNRSRR